MGKLDYKDKNGVELKEGDRVRVGTHTYSGVRYSEGIITWDRWCYIIKGCGFNFQHIFNNEIEKINKDE